jgi:hypothetical protein
VNQGCKSSSPPWQIELTSEGRKSRMHKTEKEREEKKIWGGDASEREREERSDERFGLPNILYFQLRGSEREGERREA